MKDKWKPVQKHLHFQAGWRTYIVSVSKNGSKLLFSSYYVCFVCMDSTGGVGWGGYWGLNPGEICPEARLVLGKQVNQSCSCCLHTPVFAMGAVCVIGVWGVGIAKARRGCGQVGQRMASITPAEAADEPTGRHLNATQRSVSLLRTDFVDHRPWRETGDRRQVTSPSWFQPVWLLLNQFSVLFLFEPRALFCDSFYIILFCFYCSFSLVFLYSAFYFCPAL